MSGSVEKLEPYVVRIATHEDIADIVRLQKANLIANGGMLSVEFPPQWLESTMTEMPVVVVLRDVLLVAYLVSSTPAATRHLPLSQAKFAAYPPNSTSYNYGPVCISESERGQGIARMMFEILRQKLAGREAVAFIRCDNTASRKAHVRLGLQQVAEFSHETCDYVVVACRH